MTFNEAFEEVDNIQTTEGAALGDHIIKMQEELGEIAESYLMLKSYKKPKSEKAVEELHLAEEAIDAIIVGMAILSCMKVSPEFTQATLREKTKKWRSNLAEKHSSQ
jgi:hypothetical protein